MRRQLRRVVRCDGNQSIKKELTMKSLVKFAMVCTLALASLGFAHAQTSASALGVERIQKEVRKRLLGLPFLSVFDNLAYSVNGYDVTLTGQVTRPTLRSDAENVVKKIEGVEHINNQIEVLPNSPFDDDL